MRAAAEAETNKKQERVDMFWEDLQAAYLREAARYWHWRREMDKVEEALRKSVSVTAKV